MIDSHRPVTDNTFYPHCLLIPVTTGARQAPPKAWQLVGVAVPSYQYGELITDTHQLNLRLDEHEETANTPMAGYCSRVRMRTVSHPGKHLLKFIT